jgi:hypothetical protein
MGIKNFTSPQRQQGHPLLALRAGEERVDFAVS